MVRTSISLVWRFFERENSVTHYFCNVGDCKSSFKLPRSTTAAASHLQSHHKNQYQEFQTLEEEKKNSNNNQSMMQTTLKGFNSAILSQNQKEISNNLFTKLLFAPGTFPPPFSVSPRLLERNKVIYTNIYQITISYPYKYINELLLMTDSKKELKGEIEKRFKKYLFCDNKIGNPLFALGTFFTPNKLFLLDEPVLDYLKNLIFQLLDKKPQDHPRTSFSGQMRKKKKRIYQNKLMRDITEYVDYCLAIDRKLDPFEYRNNYDYDSRFKSLALDILSCPSSSSGIERAFSCAGLFSNGNRNSIGSKSLNQRMILYMNQDLD
uniref:Dimer_Tnp_hAT domain-containing protein n=1 Tax=Rhabditophanes sp. KR3021 TaxID=114890 RepID=A0AC35U8L1_9BILA